MKSQKSTEWEQSYLDYDKLKKMIKELEENQVGLIDSTGKGISVLFVPFAPYDSR